jgi:hypothetical protein
MTPGRILPVEIQGDDPSEPEFVTLPSCANAGSGDRKIQHEAQEACPYV